MGGLSQTGSPGAQISMVRASREPNPTARGGRAPWPVVPSGTARVRGLRAGSPNRPTACTSFAGMRGSRPVPMREARSPATWAPWE